MIAANELRLGNWILIKDKLLGDIEVQITGIVIGDETIPDQIHYKWDKGFGTIHSFGDVYPIPLTEEILLKCGFEELYKSKYTRKLEHKVYFFIEWIERPYKKCIYYNNHPFEHIKYLHQLQNLFKSLTGNDLKIEV